MREIGKKLETDGGVCCNFCNFVCRFYY